MGKAIQVEGRPAWAEISLGAVVHNFRLIRRHVGRKRKVLSVVKANGYGHGAVPVAKALERAGTDWLGVTCTGEGAELREAGCRKPILLLTGFWPGEERRMLRYKLTPAVTDVSQLALLERGARRARKPVAFHLKIDTGMNRLGLWPDDVDRFAAALADCRHLRLEGTMTHFASSEDFTHEQTEQQERRFAGALARMAELGLRPGIVHMANSAAIAMRPSTWADMVRPGALLYGYHQRYEPPELCAEVTEQLPLRPVLSLRTRIISLKETPEGAGVGYNASFVARRHSRIAVIAAGFADGLLRKMSNISRVIVRGRCVPIVGTVSMDLTMLDVTDLPEARTGDLVTIFGAEGVARRDVSEVAAELGTVTADLVCSLGRRVPKFYLNR
jgi:alanine racemase